MATKQKHARGGKVPAPVVQGALAKVQGPAVPPLAKPAAPAPAAPATTLGAQAAAAATAKQQAEDNTRYTVVPPKRPLTGTKYGQAGNAHTHAALVAAAQAAGGQLTWTQVQEVCKACAHASFAAYARNRLRILVPVENK